MTHRPSTLRSKKPHSIDTRVIVIELLVDAILQAPDVGTLKRLVLNLVDLRRDETISFSDFRVCIQAIAEQVRTVFTSFEGIFDSVEEVQAGTVVKDPAEVQSLIRHNRHGRGRAARLARKRLREFLGELHARSEKVGAA